MARGVAFRASSNSPQNITVTGTSAAYPFPVGNSGGNTVLMQNAGTKPVFFAWGGPDIEAEEPTWDGTDGSHVLLPGAIMVLSKPQGNNFIPGVTHIAFVCASDDSGQLVSFASGEGD